MRSFRDFIPEERRNYITLSTGEYYPDILKDACRLYTPVLETFSQLLKKSESSSALFLNIADTPAKQICKDFGKGFRAIQTVQERFDARPMPDEALCAILWEYKDRGKKGYDLTEKFFNMIQSKFTDLYIWGPKRAGADIQAKEIWKDFPNDSRPLDFVISSYDKKTIYAVGLARYDGDRGGVQEDDRTGGYKNCADEILSYVHSHDLNTKLIFLNDGPGLLLGSMWEDYSKIEDRYPNEVKVITLRMLDERLPKEWLTGE